MSFLPVLTQTMILFMLILIGFAIKKKNVVTDQMLKDLSGLIMNITLPALIMTSMSYKFSMDMFNNAVMIFGYGAISYAFAIIFAFVFNKIFKTEEPEKGVYSFLIVFPNTAFMGFPILNAIYGETGIFYGAVYNILFNIIMWTLGVKYLTAHSKLKDRKESMLKDFLNPGMVSIFIGILFFLAPFEIPEIINSPLKLLGDTTTPLAMLVSGGMLANIKGTEVLKNKKLYIVTVLRLLTMPILMLFLLSMLPMPEIIRGALVVLSGMPSAMNTAIFATKYNSNSKLASQGVFITTLLNMISAPLIIYLLTKI
ncbi:hypothetical protein SAMN05660462_00603 [Proteiniborus ethanoligenes]|uniref:Uncharacterized protein n=1 Tax=Proteiniborus ethanoligenes TaxID=415015 RepID=A0A1H3LQE5_9FIRM|nr:AEC family transporter [Proteiniborus ethanoligenes]SDY66787.1 hypothetical protein SAMN05660462_00603 [Proteiniborus ethanoligenes]